MKFLSYLALLLSSTLASAISITLPTTGSNTGFFVQFTSMMQTIINWMSGPYVLFISIIIFIAFAVGYSLDPRSAFIQSLMKAGFTIVGIFASFSAILFIYNQF